MNRNIVVISALALICVTLSACSRQPNAAIQPAQLSNESFKASANYEMHYNALRSDQLTADIARAYGIERSKNKVLLNVSVLHKGSSAPVAVDATVTVLARNLNNQIKDMPMRRVTEGNAIYFIGVTDISSAETMVFEIKATPTGSSDVIEATLTREFFTN